MQELHSSGWWRRMTVVTECQPCLNVGYLLLPRPCHHLHPTLHFLLPMPTSKFFATLSLQPPPQICATSYFFRLSLTAQVIVLVTNKFLICERHIHSLFRRLEDVYVVQTLTLNISSFQMNSQEIQFAMYMENQQ